MAVVHALLPFVGRWIRNALSIQLFGNTEYACSGEKPVENIADNGGSRLVNQQPTVVVRVFAVAVGRERADEFALAALQVKRSADFIGDIVRVLVIEDVAERHDQAVRRARVGNAVDALAQRDEPHVQQRKRVLKVLADLDVVASQSG